MSSKASVPGEAEKYEVSSRLAFLQQLSCPSIEASACSNLKAQADAYAKQLANGKSFFGGWGVAGLALEGLARALSMWLSCRQPAHDCGSSSHHPSLHLGNALSWAPITSVKVVNTVACVMLEAYAVVEKAYKTYFTEKKTKDEIANAAQDALKK